MVPGEVDVERQGVVEVGECYTVLCPHGLTDDDLVDVVELIPVLISEGNGIVTVDGKLIREGVRVIVLV